MFGGRDFAYLRIVPPSAAVTAISSRPHAAAPAVLDALLPLCAALLALAFAAMLLRSFLRRRSGEKVLWASASSSSLWQPPARRPPAVRLEP
jgi:hypothetical protein